MNNIEKKIFELETRISEHQINREKKFLISEMKKVGIEKLPYSYSALERFIDSKTMNIHYTKHYKGYVDKLNDALSKKKYGDLDLEQIIKKISRFDKTIRNNAGGAFNHALFWKMLSPKPTKLKGELYKKIVSQFGGFNEFKKEFEKIAKERFGSGWVWLVVTPKNRLKIMSTPNQDNPLMNVVEGGGFPILGLDLWEHAYYLKYQNKRDEYISNFWKVVNWDFVEKLYEMKVETKLIESNSLKKLISESNQSQFCGPEKMFFKEMLGDSKIKDIYKTGINDILKKVFPQHWVESTNTEMAGFYGVENDAGRSILNNLNTNYNTFCLLVKSVNKKLDEINRPDKKFNFSLKERRTKEDVITFLKALDYFREDIFNKNNPDFINIINILNQLWLRGEKTEGVAVKKLTRYFENRADVNQISGHGSKLDAMKGIDVIISKGDKKVTGQIKPYERSEESDDKIQIIGTAQERKYLVDWMIFVNSKTNEILIFKNNPSIEDGNYVFDKKALLYKIN